MLVKNWMSKDVITVHMNDPLIEAIRLLKHNDIGRLPVMKKGKMVGIVTDRDIKRASASDAVSLEIHELLYLLSKIRIEEIMTKDPITVPPDYTIEETAEVLFENKISSTPVVDDQDQLVGIITQNDLFRALISLTGERKKGIQFAFIVEDRPGSTKALTDIVHKYDGRVVSILSSYDKVPAGYHRIYIKICETEREKLSKLKKELKDESTMLYFIDQMGRKREIYK